MKKTLVYIVIATGLAAPLQQALAESTHYVRYSDAEGISYGMISGERILQLDSAPWLDGQQTGVSVPRKQARLLAPVKPSKVFAVGFNYDSHRGDRELPAHPPVFLKLPTTITGTDTLITPPAGTTELHYEAELVVVMGKTAKNISAASAPDYIFGVTAGNDISERRWQADDLQWFRGKASDNFGPIGPAVVTGLNYNDVLVQSRLNGEVMQSQRTRDFIHDAHAIVSHISQYATLYPGDIIFTGTPGQTSAMKPGDEIEIEIEGVGILRNTVGEF
ncbi:MAG: fumarylacetoacetate hydrolase family protein [Woeseia sp.]|nr:fumarylacetoacetate hydrolase family protein [Woeseia sp.]NNL54650.1 fumarylacetoacetate hydrolase family protein [Woeseia sp.]